MLPSQCSAIGAADVLKFGEMYNQRLSGLMLWGCGDRSVRSYIAEVLIDVGHNLRYARSEVVEALKDEARRNSHTDFPESSSYTFTYSSLRCLLTKIDSGVLDRKLCYYI